MYGPVFDFSDFDNTQLYRQPNKNVLSPLNSKILRIIGKNIVEIKIYLIKQGVRTGF